MIKAAACFAVALGGAAMADPTYTFVDYDQLDGWAEDNHQLALEVFRNTCADIDRPEFARLCEVAKSSPVARDFFETFFQPVLIEDGKDMLFTGYFEPEIAGALSPSGAYPYPIYSLPPDLRSSGTYYSRREIDEGALAEQDLEIAWVADPVDLFFLQVQGSGRIRLPDGQVIRVGYAGKNGRSYSSIGQELVRRGVYNSSQVSADVIRNWVRNNPEAGRELLWVNESYVFFRKLDDVPANRGPLGAMSRSITPMRSIAVDPDITILGAPVWIEKDGETPLRQLMVAQDTGSAIKGAQRADIYFGTGNSAGRAAGRIKDGGRMIVLMPVQYALSKLPQDL